MITNSGRIAIMQAVLDGIVAVSIGDGSVDETLTPPVPIAPSPEAAFLNRQFFFEPRVQSKTIIKPEDGSSPRLLFSHTFENNLINPIGRQISFISEFGLFSKDPVTGLYVLVVYKTFDPEDFRIPATGSAVVRDSVQINIELF